jgi:hypothetical protein
MATAAEVASVRININEPTQDPFNDATVEAWIDDTGSVEAASAAGWRVKAGLYSELVDETEAGTSHKFSDLHKSALAMASAYDKSAAVLYPAATGRTRVRVIERS